MSKPNVNKRSTSSWLDSVSPSGETYPCQHGQVYSCGDIFNVFCGFCNTLNSVSKRNAAAASSFTCAKCHESVSNNNEVVACDGFNLIRLYNKSIGNFDCLTGYIAVKPKLARQNGYITGEQLSDVKILKQIQSKQQAMIDLVGIEPDPGPPLKDPKKAYPQKSQKQKKRNQKKKANRNRKRKSALHDLLSQHYKNVLNPFEHPAPIHDLTTDDITINKFSSTMQSTFALNADGSGFMVVYPNNIMRTATSAVDARLNFLTINNSATGVSATYTGVNGLNSNTLVGVYPKHKVVSCAIKASALIGRDATPGIYFGGTVSNDGATTLTAFTNSTTSLIGNPLLKRFSSNETDHVFINWKPDTESVPQNGQVLNYYAANNKQLNNGMLVAFTGFPASTVIMYDIVLHGEGGQTFGTGATLPVQFPSITNGSKVPSLGEIGINNPGVLYEPPGIFHNPYGEEDGKYTKESNPFANVSDAFDKVGGILSTLQDVGGAIASFI